MVATTPAVTFLFTDIEDSTKLCPARAWQPVGHCRLAAQPGLVAAALRDCPAPALNEESLAIERELGNRNPKMILSLADLAQPGTSARERYRASPD